MARVCTSHQDSIARHPCTKRWAVEAAVVEAVVLVVAVLSPAAMTLAGDGKVAVAGEVVTGHRTSAHVMAGANQPLADQPPRTEQRDREAEDTPPPEQAAPLALEQAPETERQTLTRLLESDLWLRRVIAAIRMERYACDQSRTILINLLSDPDWQVRCFAIRVLSRRPDRDQLPFVDDPSYFEKEEHPRVVRALVRHRFPYDTERLGRGIKLLARSSDLADKLLAAELAAASGDDELKDLGTEAVRTVILRMSRAEAGLFGPRLDLLTHTRGMRRPYQWRNWLRKQGRRFEMRPVWGLPDDREAIEPAAIAELDSVAFNDLEQYVEELNDRDVDLAIVIDCTASMYAELSEAQGGVDDMMMFLNDVLASLRVGLVAYRDRREEFETAGWPFTSSVEQMRQTLWKLSASGGGDGPEMVYEALQAAYGQLNWDPERRMVLVLIGDAPPHVGYGNKCVELARRGWDHELVTHTIQTTERGVKHFPEIAEAGGGECLMLENSEMLIPEVIGLTLGDRFEEEFREMLHAYLYLCR